MAEEEDQVRNFCKEEIEDDDKLQASKANLADEKQDLVYNESKGAQPSTSGSTFNNRVPSSNGNTTCSSLPSHTYADAPLKPNGAFVQVQPSKSYDANSLNPPSPFFFPQLSPCYPFLSSGNLHSSLHSPHSPSGWPPPWTLWPPFAAAAAAAAAQSPKASSDASSLSQNASTSSSTTPAHQKHAPVINALTGFPGSPIPLIPAAAMYGGPWFFPGNHAAAIMSMHSRLNGFSANSDHPLNSLSKVQFTPSQTNPLNLALQPSGSSSSSANGHNHNHQRSSIGASGKTSSSSSSTHSIGSSNKVHGHPQKIKQRDREKHDDRPHVKKPLNAFMLYMKEKRAEVMQEEGIKERQSAEINRILGRRWHALTREEQQKYYDLAKLERATHLEKFPNWSAKDNYAVNKKNKKKKRERSVGNPEAKKCRARYGIDQTDKWCKHCRRKKKCLRYIEYEKQLAAAAAAAVSNGECSPPAMVSSTTLDPLLGQVAGSSASFPVPSGGRAFAYAEFSPQVTSTSGYANGPGSNESIGGQGERHSSSATGDSSSESLSSFGSPAASASSPSSPVEDQMRNSRASTSSEIASLQKLTAAMIPSVLSPSSGNPPPQLMPTLARVNT